MPFRTGRHRQPGRASHALHQRGRRTQPRVPARALTTHRALHGARPARLVRPGGRRSRVHRSGHHVRRAAGPQHPSTSTTTCSNVRLVASGAEAVWVGWGFVAEHAEFADLCDKLGVVFIGPSGDAMRRVGDKIGAKRLAEEAGVPVVPWSGGPVDRPRRSRRRRRPCRLPAVRQGDRGWRRPRHPPGREARPSSAAAFEAARTRGSARVRRPDGVPRTADHRRSPRRGPGDRRSPRQRVGGRTS